MRSCFSFRRRILAKQLGDFVRVYGKVYFSLLNIFLWNTLGLVRLLTILVFFLLFSLSNPVFSFHCLFI